MCRFRLQGPYGKKFVHICDNCGRRHISKYDNPGLITRKCVGPGVIKKTTNFTQSSFKYVKAGRPRRTDEEIDKILDICHNCPTKRFNGKICTRCGCPINRERKWLNKLKWGTERCPDGHW